MRIVVNDIAANEGGALTVVRDFYNYIVESDDDNEWIFLLGELILEERDNIRIITLPQIKKSRIKKLFFDYLLGKKFIEKLNPDCVLSLQNIITFGLRCPQFVFVHQAIPFQKIKKFSFFRSEERKLAIYQYLIGTVIKHSIKKADVVFVQTDWMKQAICESCDINESKVIKVSPNFKPITEMNCQEIFNRNNFFYPTANFIYKNNECLYLACKLLDTDAVDYKLKMTMKKENLIESEKIDFVGRLKYEDVIKEYRASTLIFPSYIETFGYPLIEARAVGAIILASNTPFAHEVLEGYENAYYFDPFKPDELATLMKQVIKGDIQKEKCTFECNERGINTWSIIMERIKDCESCS